MNADLFERSSTFFTQLQDRILTALERVDGEAVFIHDDWSRDPTTATGPIKGGGGRTRVLEDGAVFEKAGVNFSRVWGTFPEDYANQFPGDGLDFMACGISLVLHPKNPFVPTVHMNYRRLSRGSSGWFGGGADLTPYYLCEDSARHFHGTLKRACDDHPKVADYTAFKEQCDRYFYLPHRNEARGVGGIFFDHISDNPEETLDFVKSAGDAFLDAYLPIVQRYKSKPYNDDHRAWQLYRRGRYVEFNLVHDRGTSFGLRTGGRVESILMSLPNLVSWKYNHKPAAGSAEAELVDIVTTPRAWTT